MRLDIELKKVAERFPNKVFLVCGKRRLTYGEFVELVDGMAGALANRGVCRGDRIVIFHDNDTAAATGIFAAARLGAVFSLVNPLTKSPKLKFIIETLEAKIVITQSRLLSVVRDARSTNSAVFRILLSDAIPVGEVHPLEESLSAAIAESPRPPTGFSGIDLDLAYVAFTSGSTGLPKGAMMTHQSAVSGALSMVSYLENTASDVVVSAVPLAFDYGLYQLIMVSLFGGTLILEKGIVFPAQFVQRAQEERATGLPLVPTSIALLLQANALKKRCLPSLRYITTTAAPLPPAHSERLQSLFPECQIYSNYGLTEVVRGTFLPPSELSRRPTSVGRAMPNAEVELVDEDGHPVPPELVGELTFRGASLMKGYWRNEQATKAALRPGKYPWEAIFHTGDLFKMDDEGFLFFVGRKDDLIKSRGEKVGPAEVERAIYELPQVHEVAVVPIPHPIWGNAIKAVVVTAAGAHISELEIKRHCASKLEDYMIPHEIEFRDALPKTESGKVHRRLLVS